MKKLLMLFVDGYEDTEAIATLDVLTRGGDQVICASMMKRREITPKLGRRVMVDTTIEEVSMLDFDGLIIPGGPGSFKILPDNPYIDAIINYFAEEHRLVASICAAPHLVGRLGLLKDKNFTVHPGFEDEVIGGHYLREQGVVVDDNFITAKSMYYSIPFGLAIHEYFHGENSRKTLEKACMGE
ncbi:MAG: DJ-1/PfpI family protein [Bacilli bacterium]|nr:DJ-1/PfpI family protein [Bacilli bacterium]